MKTFEDWWPTVNQTIGKSAAKAAWDYRQTEIDKLQSQIQEMVEKAASKHRPAYDEQQRKIFKLEIRNEELRAAIKLINSGK